MYLTIQKRRFFLAFSLILTGWALLQWFYARPDNLINDWNSWQQVEAQSIAKNLLEDFRLLDPKVDWSGEETYKPAAGMSLYSALVAGFLRSYPGAEWPGQLLSLLFMSLGSAALFVLFLRMFRPLPALLGSLVFLSTLSASLLSTAVHPDAMGFLFYVLSLYFFFAFLEEDTISSLACSACLGLLAIIATPEAVHLVATQLLLILCYKKKALLRPFVWAQWGALLSLFLYQSISFHLEFWKPELAGWPSYGKLAQMTFKSGAGVLGALAFAYLLFTNKLNGVCLAIGSGILLLFCLGTDNGMTCLLFASFFGSLLIAQGSDRFFRSSYGHRTKLAVTFLLAGAIFMTMGWNTRQRALYPQKKDPFQQTIGAALKLINKTEDRVIVRSRYKKQGQGQYLDPSIFYVAENEGWVISAEMDRLSDFLSFVENGAHYYVEPTGHATREILHWLEENARVVYRNKFGTIYKIMPPPRQMSPE